MNYNRLSTCRSPYFKGWYLKHQAQEGELAVLPAIHREKRGELSASIQIATPTGSKLFSFSGKSVAIWPDRFQIRVGDNWFSRDGIHLDLADEEMSLKGELQYGPFAQPCLQVHAGMGTASARRWGREVLSMGHRIEGLVSINGMQQLYLDGTGYIEARQGYSGPCAYLWLQCAWRERQQGSLMLCVAQAPFGRTVAACEIRFAGQPYRLSTGQGAKVERWTAQGALLCQGSLRLEVEVLRGDCQRLLVPEGGAMTRHISQSLRATVRCRLWVGKAVVFDHIDVQAGYEHAQAEVNRHLPRNVRC